MSEKKVYNFAAGPACLPQSVLLQAQSEMLNYKNSGCSIMELSHRSKLFEEVIQEAENNLKALLKIPKNYKVLFFQGGGTAQFAAVPLNLLGTKSSADYVVTGSWSQKAFQEAKKYTNAKLVCTGEKTKYTKIPEKSEWTVTADSAYLYFCANETIHGVEFQDCPDVDSNVVLVADMSSNFLSRPVDVSKYGAIIAGAQKNSGIAGVTIVIVREDLLDRVAANTPTALSYKVFSDNKSLFNTPPTWSIYIANLVYKWILDQGGVEAIEKLNIQKSNIIYELVDNSNGFYTCPVAVDKSCRSRMNIPLRIKENDEKLEKLFIQEAAALNLIELAGHRSVGGLRISLYNAMPLEGVQLLAQFMKDFQQKYSS